MEMSSNRSRIDLEVCLRCSLAFLATLVAMARTASLGVAHSLEVV